MAAGFVFSCRPSQMVPLKIQHRKEEQWGGALRWWRHRCWSEKSWLESLEWEFTSNNVSVCVCVCQHQRKLLSSHSAQESFYGNGADVQSVCLQARVWFLCTNRNLTSFNHVPKTKRAANHWFSVRVIDDLHGRAPRSKQPNVKFGSAQKRLGSNRHWHDWL